MPRIARRAWVTILICAAAASAATPELTGPITTRNVLILFAWDVQSMSPYMADDLAELTRAPQRVQLFDEYMDAARFPDPGRNALFTEMLKHKYPGFRFDAIALVGYPAVDFWTKNGTEIAPGAPVLVIGIEARRIQEMHLPPYFAGETSSFNDRALIDWMFRLQPDLRNLYLPVGASTIETQWAAQRISAIRSFKPALKCTSVPATTKANLTNELGRLEPHSAVLLQAMYEDGTGRYFTPGAAFALVFHSANAPIYTNFISSLRAGALGGEIIDYQAARHLISLLLRLFRGESPQNIGMASIPQAFMLDWRQLQRWHIDPRRIPPNTIVLNREYSFWELYAGRTLTASGILLAEAGLITLLMYELRRRRRTEAGLHELSGKLLTAQEEERGRIARELHDDVGQQLAMLGFGLNALQRQLTGSPGKASEKANLLNEQLVRLSGSLRDLSHRLHPSVLDYAGLPAALRSQAADIQAYSGIEITVDASEEAAKIPPQVALALFRVCQEALRNVVKHAKATAATVELECNNKKVSLRIHDNGIGFPIRDAPSGAGLHTIEERVRLLGGELSIESHPHSGSTIYVSVSLSDIPVSWGGSFTDRDPPNRQGENVIAT